MADFNQIESLFLRLKAASQSVLSESELAEVQGFVDAGEYGLALETAVDIYTEEQKRASSEVIHLVKCLATAMAMDVIPFLDKLDEPES